MSTPPKNEIVDEGAGKPASKSKRKKLQPVHYSNDKTERFHASAAYALTSSKNLAPKNISWLESEWPELPKSSSSQLENAGEGSSHFDGGTNSGESGLSSRPYDEGCLQEEHTQQYETKSIQTSQSCFICPPKELEHITSSLSALNMSSKCQLLSTTETRENVLSQQGCLKKMPSAIQRKGKKLLAGKLNSAVLLTEKPASEENSDPSPISDNDFPDLLALKKIKKGRKKILVPVEDVTAKKVTKKYPRRTDPISINLGEVLELTSSCKDSRNVLRSRYSRDTWPKTRIDTSRRVIKRGKQREFPKRKTLTKLKLAILKGRRHKINSRLHRSGNLSNEGACSLERVSTLESVHSCKQTTLEDCQLLLGEETLLDLRYLFGHCSSDVNLSIGGFQIKSDLLKASERNPKCGPSQLTQESFSDREILQLAKSSIHTRKFREYCSNDNGAVLQEKVKSFVKQIYRFQTKAHFRDAEKARIHRRYVLGLREADKYFKLRKLKLVVIATDLEANSEEGGLDEVIENMKSRARMENIPIIFALKRRDLAYCVFRKVPVSCMAVLNYEGAEDLYRAMMDAWREAAVTYDKKLEEKQQEILCPEQACTDGCASAGNVASSCEPRDHAEELQTIDESEI